ncbi:unnamed protein product [Ixodes persulcatus]
MPGALEQTMPGELEQTLCLDALNVGGTVDAKEQSSVCVQKQPEVDVLPEAMEGTDVCTAANEPQPQDFEAGPEVAQFSKKEILSFEASLKDPSDLDFLPKVASSGRLQKTHPGRRSTLLKFDPLLSELRPVYQSSVHSIEEQQPEEQQSSALNSSTDSGERLIDLVDSPMKVRKYSSREETEAAEPMFSENEMTQALKCQELVFQERLLIKDRDYMNEQYNLRQEVEAWRAKFVHMGGLYQLQENTVMMLKSHIEQIVSTMERHVLGKKDADEKIALLLKITKERDELAEDLRDTELAFASLYLRNENAKQAITMMKKYESTLKQQLAEFPEIIQKSNQMLNLLGAKTAESPEVDSEEFEDLEKNFQADIAVLRGQMKKAEVDKSSLETRLEQETEKFSAGQAAR